MPSTQYDRLVNALKKANLQLEKNEFNATLKALCAIEYGITKPKALKSASLKYGVSQTRINETLKLIRVKQTALKRARKSMPILKEVVRMNGEYKSKVSGE